tara:strand:- start:674 stop:1516 length:843 start_codon:yes stop_codon:yes gene_type:complete
MAKTQLTDAQIKAQLIAKTQQQTKAEDNSLFPTEIIPLPSKGLVYPLDHPLSSGEVEIRYMTAKDEDILTNPNYLKRGLALDKLYEAIVVGNGKGLPVNMNEMIMGDRSAVMLAARLLGYGSDYDIKVTHPDTGKEIPYTVDLNQLKPKEIDESLYNNTKEFEYELPVSKKKVVFKLQTIVEQKAIEKDIRAQEKAGIPLRNQTTTLKHCIVSIDGNDDNKFITDFVDNYLLAKDSLHLRKYMLDINPDFDLTVTIDIPGEDFYQEMALPIDTTFFWPRL